MYMCVCVYLYRRARHYSNVAGEKNFNRAPTLITRFQNYLADARSVGEVRGAETRGERERDCVCHASPAAMIERFHFALDTERRDGLIREVSSFEDTRRPANIAAVQLKAASPSYSAKTLSVDLHRSYFRRHYAKDRTPMRFLFSAVFNRRRSIVKLLERICIN